MTIYNEISANKRKTWMIFLLFILIFTGFFFLLGKFMDNTVAYGILGFIIAMGSSVGSYFYSDKLVLSQTHARPATKEEFFDLYTVTENLAIADGLPTPKIYVIDDPAPNAFATGRDPKHAVVCATTGLLQRLDRSELEGVIAHELSHVKNYDILVATITAVLVGTLALIANWVMRSMWWGRDDRESRNNPIMYALFILVLIITPIAATLIQLAVSRKREYLADASGALITRYPEGLARALEKISSDPTPMHSATTSTAHLFISNPFKKGSGMSSWLTNLFSTHPPIEKRIQILRSM